VANIDFLTFHELIKIGEALISDFRIGDLGSLESAATRPQTTVFGKDAYPSFTEKAAALMHSIARNHALIDGNKRLAWSATRTFCLINGYDINFDVDDAERIVVGVASGEYDAPAIAEMLNIKKSK
jgi:death-on-curing protein